MTTSTPAGAANPLAFDLTGSGGKLLLSDFDLVIAGYTGRDEQSVKKHIDELAAIGVPPPDSVPAFYEVDASLATQERQVPVAGSNTSGEVEPVLIRSSGRLYLAVGSDHTDRDVERSSVADSKAACPKPLSTTLVPLGEAGSLDWDAIEARCTVDGVLYQDGSLSALRIPTDVLSLYDAYRGPSDRDLVIYCGTLPLIDGRFVPGGDWTLSLALPGGVRIEHAYSTSASIATAEG
jgi:4-hydroxyphenylacetate 3-monooxygenase